MLRNKIFGFDTVSPDANCAFEQGMMFLKRGQHEDASVAFKRAQYRA
jgi:hypothetical protein